MATENLTTFQKLHIANKRVQEAEELNTALWAISQLGDMLTAAQSDAGFESIKERHWSAIGISINRMAESLYWAHDKEIMRLEDEAGEIAARYEAEEQRIKALDLNLDVEERKEVVNFLTKFNAGEITLENVKELCPGLKPETAQKLFEYIDADLSEAS